MGNAYPSVKAMCEAWGVTEATFNSRLKRDKKTGPKSCTDHQGQTFPSLKAMCEAWGVSRTTPM